MKNPSLILQTLKLQNFATFKSHEVSFSAGLNAIVGETGSGKSLLLDALQLVFGGRADKRVVRLGTESAIVEAIFYFRNEEVDKSLEDLGFPAEGNEIVIKRMVKRDGTSKCWLNHMTCSLSQLVTFCRRYVDLVGQFENQKLLSDTYQLRLLDQFGGTTDLAESYRYKLAEYRSSLEEKITLERSQHERSQRLDYLDYQINEINELNPIEGEEEELVQVKNDYLNQERKQMLLLQLDELIDGSDTSVGLSSISRTGRSLITKNQNLITAGFSEKFSSLETLIDEIKAELRDMNIKELNTDELQDVIDRLDSYQKLKRKFGGSVSAISASRAQFIAEAESLRSAEVSLTEITKRISLQESVLSSLADQLHAKRITSAFEFSNLLTLAVRDLKMLGAEIKLSPERTTELTEQGYTKLSFLAQTNPGEGFYKVKEIASGGELSRILLALRKVLATHDSISIFLFDEIDSGMGGETALHIGKSLKKVSEQSQVVTITHLPQIASFADKLILVSKETTEENSSDRTESKVREIESLKDIKKAIESMVPLQ